jgi:DNA-binding MltR family transcriptional regulator
MKKIRVTNIDIGEELFGGEVFCFSKEFYHRFRSQMQRESDRSCVLIVGSVLDTVLKERLFKKCVQGKAELQKKLFDVGGPFSSFASKIEWLFCTGEISKPVRDDLHIVRQLRNQCAHDWEEFALNKIVEDRFLARMNAHSWITSAAQFILDSEQKHATHNVEVDPRVQFTFMSSILISTLNAVHTKTLPPDVNVAP